MILRRVLNTTLDYNILLNFKKNVKIKDTIIHITYVYKSFCRIFAIQ